MTTEPTTKQAAPERIWIDNDDCCLDAVGCGTFYTGKPTVPCTEYARAVSPTIAPTAETISRAEAMRIVNRIYGCSDHDQPQQCVDCDLRHKLLKAFAALPALSAPQPTIGEWQPIETAPKDGEDVLLWIPSEDSFVVADWRDDAKAWDADNGWLQGEPTHWMRPQSPSALVRFRC